MDKAKLLKYSTALLVTSGVAITLPAFAPFLAPAILPLTAGILSEGSVKRLGEKGIEYFVGIVGNLVASALWESPNLLKKSSENHDLLKLLAKSYSKGIEELLREIETNTEFQQDYETQAKRVLPDIKIRIDEALEKSVIDELEKLFPTKEFLETQQGTEKQKVPFLQKLFGFSSKEKVPINEEFAGKFPSEDFILSIAEDSESAKKSLASEIEISLRRWFAETTPSVDEFPKSLAPFVFERLAEIIPKYVGTLIKEEGFEKSWVAFQRSHLQAILKEVKNNKDLSDEDKELLKPLAEKLEELAKSELPQKLADSTANILSRMGESEANIKQCVKDETVKIQHYLIEIKEHLVGMEGRIIEEFHKISHERPLPNTVSPPVGFVGREGCLKQLIEPYDIESKRAFVLWGIGGGGKTATARKFAEKIGNKYEAKVFVDMQGLSENPLSAKDTMFVIVRQFEPQVPADTPDSQLEELFVQFVQNQPTLIVMDNVENESQFAPLIARADACFIVTSRNDIQLTSGKTIKLTQMSPEDAEELLFSIVEDKEKFEGRARELAELAGYLPMALKPLAKLLKRRFGTISKIIEKYKDTKKRLELVDVDRDKDWSVEASFALSYSAISDEQKKYWRSLAVFPADFESQSASTIFGTEFDEGFKVLEQLYEYSLIEAYTEHSDEKPRFNLHDLTREFCDKQLSEDERFEAQIRHSFYFTLVLRMARSIRLNDNINGFVHSLKLVDAEWTNILAGQKWSAENLEKYSEISEICLDYSQINWNINLRLHPQIYIEWLNASLIACQKIGNSQGETYCLGNLGNAHMDLGEYRKAIEFYERALNISKEIGDRLGEGRSLGNLGNTYRILGEFQNAIEYSKQSLQITKQIGNRQGESIDLMNLGNNYLSLGEYREAIEFYRQALDISREIGDRQGEGDILGNLGSFYLNLGEHKKAIELYEQAWQISSEIGDRQSEGNHLCNLGHTYLSLSEREKACGKWKEALAIFEAIESPNANLVRQWIEKNGCE